MQYLRVTNEILEGSEKWVGVSVDYWRRSEMIDGWT